MAGARGCRRGDRGEVLGLGAWTASRAGTPRCRRRGRCREQAETKRTALSLARASVAANPHFRALAEEAAAASRVLLREGRACPTGALRLPLAAGPPPRLRVGPPKAAARADPDALLLHHQHHVRQRQRGHGLR